MVQQKRRVSYVIPPPSDPVPRLQLPPLGISRLGQTAPLLVPLQNNTEPDHPKWPKHPRHRLGITSLALDTSTQLAGRGAPEGILYSAGRDGLIISWDLGIPMQKRRPKNVNNLRRTDLRWEAMTGWADDAAEDDPENGDDRLYSDGDVLGDVTIGARRPRQDPSAIPYEQQWETDMTLFKPGKPSEFRQCAQVNSDWVNDILLHNRQQNVISASSDGTVKSWSPHFPGSPDPSTIGTHSDYVRCLAHSREQNWVASGSFDRTIKLWDLSRTGQHDALVTMNPPDTNAPKSSIYALAADPYGTTIVSGSPERVVRLWDPRTGKRTGKLVGHTDNIRAILISDDGKYLLTGSADASIKLWSLVSQRCLHTFTHHSESVWSLYSTHRSLEVFYSGDRTGLVCKVDVEDCSDISEGECTVLCQDTDPSGRSSDGINKIVVMDDHLLWTASGHSNIKRWSVLQPRSFSLSLDEEGNGQSRSESPVPYDSVEPPSATSTRSFFASTSSASYAASLQSLSSDTRPSATARNGDTQLNGVPFESMVRLRSPNEHFTYTTSYGRDPEVATLYSAASIKSVPRTNNNTRPVAVAVASDFPLSAHDDLGYDKRNEDASKPGVHTAHADYEERELASDAVPLQSEPEDVIPGEHGLVRSIILNDRIHALTVDTAGEVAVWNIVRGVCLGRWTSDDVSALSKAGSWAGGSGENNNRERSPREALEAVRERIEGEAVVSAWSTADTKAGVLTIHLTERSFESEVYADEVGYANDRRFTDESKLNVGKWVLRNLFLGFIREEQKIRRSKDDGASDGRSSHHDPTGSPSRPTGPVFPVKPSTVFSTSVVVQSPKMIPALPPLAAPTTRSSPLLTPLIPLHLRELSLPAIPQSPAVGSNDTTPMPRRSRSVHGDDAETPMIPNSTHSDYFSVRNRRPSVSGAASAGLGTTDSAETPGSAGFGKTDPLLTPTTPGGLMVRLKNFGKTRRPPSEVSGSPVVSSVVISNETLVHATAEETPRPLELDIPKTPSQLVLSGTISPPSSAEAPTFPTPTNMIIYISEENTPSYTTLYRGTVSSTKYDVQVLEDVMPLWLLEYLVLDKLPPVPAHQKISFVLLPWPAADPKDQLPELLNTTQSRLTSTRYLRVRKLVVHVQEKLDKILPRPPEPESTQEGQEPKPRPRAEDEYEILCNDVLLPLGMSLAVVRQYIWKQSTEVTMYYRRKLPSSD